jgi:hypothetical protein
MVAKFLLLILWMFLFPLIIILMAIPLSIALAINLAIFLVGLLFVLLGIGSIVGFFIGMWFAEITWGYIDQNLFSLAMEFASPCWDFWYQTYTKILYYKSEGFLY